MEKKTPIAESRKSIRRPGRPVASSETQNNIREKILNSAEQLFAENGWTATSFRDIATHAGVNPAMITYYFGTKQNLVEVAFKRRATQIADRWLERIDALESRPNQQPTVYELLHSYLSVAFDIKNNDPAEKNFLKLQARVHNEADEFCFRLRREVYDVATQRYIAALERALPDVDPADISWRIIFVIGAYLYMLAGVDRLKDLSGERYQSNNFEEMAERATTFMVGGMAAPSTPYTPAAAKGKAKAPRSRSASAKKA